MIVEAFGVRVYLRCLADALVALNPMGKLPILVDGDAVVTESAAIGLYLADRHSLGRLAPAPDDPARAIVDAEQWGDAGSSSTGVAWHVFFFRVNTQGEVLVYFVLRPS
jgi:glutathione S-transferase